MAAVQLRCRKTGKMKYVSRCMRKNCSNLVVSILTIDAWRLAVPKLLKREIGTKFMCKPE